MNKTTIMKSAIKLLAAVGILFVTQAQAQSPNSYQLFTNSAAILCPGITVTNFPVTMTRWVPVGVNGIAFYVGAGGTNAATTTNANLVLEAVHIDTKTGQTNVVDNQTWTVSFPQSGATRYDFFTNIVNTSPNIGNQLFVRIRSCDNTNLASVWITNAAAYVR